MDRPLTRISPNNPRCKGNFPIGEKSPTLYCWPAGPASVHSANNRLTDSTHKILEDGQIKGVLQSLYCSIPIQVQGSLFPDIFRKTSPSWSFSCLVRGIGTVPLLLAQVSWIFCPYLSFFSQPTLISFECHTLSRIFRDAHRNSKSWFMLTPSCKEAWV